MKIYSIKTAKNIKNKRIFLRTDFNLPIKNNKILDDHRMRASLPTIEYLLKQGGKIIIGTHLGRPKGKSYKQYSTKLLAEHMQSLLRHAVIHADGILEFNTTTLLSKMKAGDIVMLENLRFSDGETANKLTYAKKLAKYFDLYINDAFGVSHRKEASVSAIQNYLPSYAGLLLEQEVLHLKKILSPEKPLISILGGAKIKTKLPIIKNLLIRSERVLIGGILANNFLAARGHNTGKSYDNPKDIKLAGKIKSDKIILPIDAIVSEKKDGSGKIKVKDIRNIANRDYIFDIGPKTIKLYAHLIKKAKTLVWNGPMGMFEQPRLKHGTHAIARLVAARSQGAAFGVAGGGETLVAINQVKMIEYLDWASTGGGAMLAFLGGELMPGFKKIIK